MTRIKRDDDPDLPTPEYVRGEEVRRLTGGGTPEKISQKMVAQMMKDPDSLRRFFVEGNVQAVAEAFSKAIRGESPFRCQGCGCHRPQRWAILQFFEISGLARKQIDVTMEIVGQLGLSSLDEARRIVGEWRSAESSDMGGRVRACEVFLSQIYEVEPEWKEKSLLRRHFHNGGSTSESAPAAAQAVES